MTKKLLILIILILSSFSLLSQVKVGGYIVGEDDNPIPFANVIFKGSTIGTITDENGKFYLQSDTFYKQLEISFLGFKTEVVELQKSIYDLKVILTEDTGTLKEVKVYSGRIKNKGNPAVSVLKKIWAKKRQNGLYLYDSYEYDKYEKIEFQLNNVDEKLRSNRVFKGMEFVFDQVDTSAITGKSYLPIFINESVYNTYGKNTVPKKINEKLVANKNSGFSDNQGLIAFIKQLYVDFDIYDNYIRFFDKSFASPLSKLGPQVYNYALTDTAYIDNKLCYNIMFYPRRKNELTFKGDFWVNDTTFAVKEIQMHATRSANINWIKEIYIEQEFDVVNDSVFLLKRDHFMSDFSLNKKDKTKGVYGKRTTLYDNHVFDLKRPDEFYRPDVKEDKEIYHQTETFWTNNRQERLSKDEVGIYEMLDTLQTVRRFKDLTSAAEILTSGYWNIAHGFDWGPLYSTIGLNEIEGLKLRLGGRTYFSQSDTWRLKGYLAYGFKDDKFKYGIEGRWLVEKRNRLILSFGNRRDIEQSAVSLTTSNDVLDKSFASTSFFTRGDNTKLSNINITNAKVSIEPVKNLELRLGTTFKTLKSADHNLFNADYYDENGNTQSVVKQSDVTLALQYTPKRKPWGLGVDRGVSNEGRFPVLYFSYSKGFKDIFNSSFDYHKFQFYYEQPFQLGLLGKSKSYIEIGKTVNPAPLLLLNVVPGNQTYAMSKRIFDLLDYYEFVTDQYASFHFEHNFNGRLFSKIPVLRKLQLREIVGVRGVVGSISDENIAINASDVTYTAPEKMYWEYHVGVGNIFKLIRIDYVMRGNYRYLPNATKSALKIGVGFNF
ncbi:MAG: DUF5686 family protein [Bacteroidota bacterium]